MKYEWCKQAKDLYSTKQQPRILTVPAQRFISLHGVGNPNGPEFQQRVQTLYPLAYGLKNAYRQYAVESASEVTDYVVFPLEGVWSLTKKGQQLDHLDKNEFSYDIMIQIPEFVPADLIQPTLDQVIAKKELTLGDQVEIKEYPEMLVAQILHVGAYDDEPASFAKIDQLVASTGHQRLSKIHREIYLSDARRVEPARLKTILRYRIKSKD